MHFIDNAAKGPHVHLCGVGQFQDDFWSSVVPRLNVFVHLLCSEAGVTEVNQLDPRFAMLFEHYVLWFQVTVDYVDVWHAEQGKCQKTLPGNNPHKVEAQASILFCLSLQTKIFTLQQQVIEVDLEALENDGYKFETT